MAVTVAVAPLASDAIAQGKEVQAPEAETNVRPAGVVSVMVMLVAVDGPLFVTVTV